VQGPPSPQSACARMNSSRTRRAANPSAISSVTGQNSSWTLLSCRQGASCSPACTGSQRVGSTYGPTRWAAGRQAGGREGRQAGASSLHPGQYRAAGWAGAAKGQQCQQPIKRGQNCTGASEQRIPGVSLLAHMQGTALIAYTPARLPTTPPACLPAALSPTLPHCRQVRRQSR